MAVKMMRIVDLFVNGEPPDDDYVVLGYYSNTTYKYSRTTTIFDVNLYIIKGQLVLTLYSGEFCVSPKRVGEVPYHYDLYPIRKLTNLEKLVYTDLYKAKPE